MEHKVREERETKSSSMWDIHSLLQTLVFLLHRPCLSSPSIVRKSPVSYNCASSSAPFFFLHFLITDVFYVLHLILNSNTPEISVRWWIKGVPLTVFGVFKYIWSVYSITIILPSFLAHVPQCEPISLVMRGRWDNQDILWLKQHLPPSLLIF